MKKYWECLTNCTNNCLCLQPTSNDVITFMLQRILPSPLLVVNLLILTVSAFISM